MTKINFLIISLIFYSFIFLSLNKIYGANEQLVCPGLKLFNRWCAGEHLENNIKACIIVTKPTKEEGDYKKTNRGQPSLTVYHLPSQDAVGIVYVTAGYKYRSESYVSINIDNKKEFDLKLIEGDTAFLDEEELEKNLVKSMKKGNNLKIIGYSTRGTKTTDTYSLMGFTSAYNHISKSCNIKTN